MAKRAQAEDVNTFPQFSDVQLQAAIDSCSAHLKGHMTNLERAMHVADRLDLRKEQMRRSSAAPCCDRG